MKRGPGVRLLAGQTKDGTPVTGVIGERQLIAVQTVEIARLTTHPVPIVPGNFIAVTGQGPKADSNGSGKTTFLSAVSLLHCDSQWRLDVDGRHATGLLFQPGAAGLDAGAGAAEHGYVIGVFARGSGEELKDPVTVWVRVSRKPPFILTRYVAELHVLHGESDQERSDQADEQWQRLPAGSETGSRLMASTLFGAAPRCLAYLDTTLRPSAPSLLSQQMTQMSPARIGEALIALTGRDQLLDEEVLVRRKHADQNAVVAGRIEDDRHHRLIEDAQLEELRRRELARRALTEADMCWDAYLAHGVIEKQKLHGDRSEELAGIQERLGKAVADLDEKKAEHKQCAANTELAVTVAIAATVRTKIDERRIAAREAIGRLKGQRDRMIQEQVDLRVRAEGDDRQPVSDHLAFVETADQVLIAAMSRHAAAQDRHQEAIDHLEATRRGRAGAVGHSLA